MAQQTDVLIIGGGVIGVCCAYFLAAAGRTVTLVEKDKICAGSSYGNAGLICPSHAAPLCAPGVLSQGLKWMLDAESPFYIKPRLDLALARWLLRFALHCTPRAYERAVPLFRELHLASLALYAEVIRREMLDCHFQQSGALTLFNTEAGLRAGQHEAEELAALGAPIEVINAARVRQLAPNVSDSVLGGLYNAEDAHLDPALLVQELAAVAERNGVRILPHNAVRGFAVQDGRVAEVQAADGALRANEVVLCAGPWSIEMARQLHLRLPMQPAKGYSITMARPADFPDIHMHLGETRVVATPMGPRLRLAGTMELAGFDFSINQRRVDAISRAAGQYFCNIANAEVVEVWRGMRPVPPDGLPYIGRSSHLKNLIVATGHSYLGISFGAITGRLVKQLVCGEEPEIDLHLLRTDRHRAG